MRRGGGGDSRSLWTWGTELARTRMKGEKREGEKTDSPVGTGGDGSGEEGRGRGRG